MDMDPAARNFLQQALSAIERYDQEGRTVLPNQAWPEILEDLGLQEGSDAAYFLMDHLEAAGDGVFTYMPLLQTLGFAPPQPYGESLDEAPPPQQGQEMGPPQDAWQELETTHKSPELRAGYEQEEQARYGGGGYEEDHYYQADNDCVRAQPESGTAPPPGELLSPPRAEPAQQISPPRAYLLESDGGYGGEAKEFAPQPPSPMSSALPGGWDRGIAEEVGEAYWANRASTIQQLFTQWDCNLLANEAFVVRLQECLGDAVDISSPESELVRKTNQHRTARNLKFAALMSALRRDAHSTASRRTGRPVSVAGSVYEPSEIGSEAPLHAAGRPTGNSRDGAARRHYDHINGQMGRPISGASSRYAPSETQRSTLGQDSRPPPVYMPSSAQPCSRDGGGGGPLDGVDEDRVQDSYSNAPAAAPMARPTACDQWEMQSQGGVTDVASVADSQREEFTWRNRTGHGNILTWGSDSRSITPHKKRAGRQVDEGGSRHMTSNIFFQR